MAMSGNDTVKAKDHQQDCKKKGNIISGVGKDRPPKGRRKTQKPFLFYNMDP